MGDTILAGGKLTPAFNLYADGGVSIFNADSRLPFSATLNGNLTWINPLGNADENNNPRNGYLGLKVASFFSVNNQQADPTQKTNFRGTQWQNEWLIGYTRTLSLNYKPGDGLNADGSAPTHVDLGLPHLSLFGGSQDLGLFFMLAPVAADWDGIPGASFKRNLGTPPGLAPFNYGAIAGHFVATNASIAEGASAATLYRPKGSPLALVAWAPSFLPGAQVLAGIGPADPVNLFSTDLLFKAIQFSMTGNVGRYKIEGDDTCTDGKAAAPGKPCEWGGAGLGSSSLALTVGATLMSLDTQPTVEGGRLNENGEEVSAKTAVDLFLMADISDWAQLGLNFTSNSQTITGPGLKLENGQNGLSVGGKVKLGGAAWLHGAVSYLWVQQKSEGVIQETENNGDKAFNVGLSLPLREGQSMLTLGGMFVLVGTQYDPAGRNISALTAIYSHNF